MAHNGAHTLLFACANSYADQVTLCADMQAKCQKTRPMSTCYSSSIYITCCCDPVQTHHAHTLALTMVTSICVAYMYMYMKIFQTSFSAWTYIQPCTKNNTCSILTRVNLLASLYTQCTCSGEILLGSSPVKILRKYLLYCVITLKFNTMSLLFYLSRVLSTAGGASSSSSPPPPQHMATL